MAFFNKAEKGAVQRASTGSATSANKAEKGAVQNGYTAAPTERQPNPGFILYQDPGVV